MGLDFSKPAMTTVTATAGQTDKNEIAVVEQYDIVADRQQMNQELVNSEEVDRIVSTIEIHNLDTIVSFGAEVADEISKASDVVLNSMNMSQLDETSEMMKALAKIMEQFDIDEIKDNPGLFGKLFGNLKKQLDKILAKYHTMGEEVDKIYVQLKGYESEIKQSNRKLSTMFDANVNYYHELVKYILDCCHSWIKLCSLATAGSLIQVHPADFTNSFAIVLAQNSHWPVHQNLGVDKFIYIQFKPNQVIRLFHLIIHKTIFFYAKFLINVEMDWRPNFFETPCTRNHNFDIYRTSNEHSCILFVTDVKCYRCFTDDRKISQPGAKRIKCNFRFLCQLLVYGLRNH